MKLSIFDNIKPDSLQPDPVAPRLKNLYAELEKKGIDCLLVISPANISYLTAFTSRDSCLLISRQKNFYFTDSRYTEEAKKNLPKDFRIIRINGPVFHQLAALCFDLGLKNLGFEEKHLSCLAYRKLRGELNRALPLIPLNGLIEEMRLLKTSYEIQMIRKAAQIAAAALGFIKDCVVSGMTELKVAAEIERFIRYNGARASAFDIIVASGPNSSLPHHLTSQRIIRDHEPVLIDIGVDYFGYKSDLTRVFFLGKMSVLAKKVYNIVKQAQGTAIKKIRPGLAINRLDAAARQYIAQKGYGGFFGHSLGHGVGLEVHEDPRISALEKRELKAGEVFTVEPGIYLPGKFGIRIEDMVLVTRKGVEVISGALNK